MPQDPLPELNKEQQALWDEILAIVQELEKRSKENPKIFRIEWEAFHIITVSLPRQPERIKALLRQLGHKLKKAAKDPALSQYSFVQRSKEIADQLAHV